MEKKAKKDLSSFSWGSSRTYSVYLLVLIWILGSLVPGNLGTQLQDGKSFTPAAIDHELLDANSHCICKITCKLNDDCTGVSIQQKDDGLVNCFFSVKEIVPSDLQYTENFFTWIYNDNTMGDSVSNFVSAVNSTDAAASIYSVMQNTTQTPGNLNSTSSGATSSTATFVNSTTQVIVIPNTSDSATANLSTDIAANQTDGDTTIVIAQTFDATMVLVQTAEATVNTTAITTNQTILSTQSCSYGYTRFENSCYYWVSKSWKFKTWALAKAACEYHDNHLVKITSIEEYNYIRDNLQVNMWIGLNDIEQEGTYKWTDGSSYEGGYATWEDGQPNNKDGTQNCIHYWAEKTKHWNDHFCSEVMGYICEYSLV